jgi:hypothetical protein
MSEQSNNNTAQIYEFDDKKYVIDPKYNTVEGLNTNLNNGMVVLESGAPTKITGLWDDNSYHKGNNGKNERWFTYYLDKDWRVWDKKYDRKSLTV